MEEENAKLKDEIKRLENRFADISGQVVALQKNEISLKNDVQVELYIDRGKEQDKENKDIFDKLFNHRDEIEKSFGEPLEWERLEGKRACRIRKRISSGGYRDEEDKRPIIHEKMIEAMIKLEKSLRPYINKLLN